MTSHLGDMFDLSGQRALVTGASRGLGRAMAEALAGAGADVVCATAHEGGARETVAAVEGMGRKGWEVVADIGNRAALDSMTVDIEMIAGPIDILVNNAGTIRRAPAVEYSLADWDVVMRTNLDSTFVLCQHYGSEMIERGAGKIINVASLLAFSGGITVPAYTASKHAVAGLTKAFANEWGRHGIQVNAIAPGYFRTDNTQALQDDETRSEQISARIPAGRWGEPSDLAGAVVFLASRASDYVNGHVLVVDGGWMAR
ncbi:MAG: 2-dehydro-3-deoxy-D-gluconate 5-dehydrogenase KduD [Gemmatimonadota bacterium]|nr:2-dehydro-3-deoxy-D-gluconate 5-dehydrogenase KduD [Gemmatimonadota bacterium]